MINPIRRRRENKSRSFLSLVGWSILCFFGGLSLADTSPESFCPEFLKLQELESSIAGFRSSEVAKPFEKLYRGLPEKPPSARALRLAFRKARRVVIGHPALPLQLLPVVQEDFPDGFTMQIPEDSEDGRYLLIAMPDELFETEIETLTEAHEWTHAVIDHLLPKLADRVQRTGDNIANLGPEAAAFLAHFDHHSERIAASVEWHLLQNIPDARLRNLIDRVNGIKGLDRDSKNMLTRMLEGKSKTLNRYLYNSLRIRAYTLRELKANWLMGQFKP